MLASFFYIKSYIITKDYITKIDDYYSIIEANYKDTLNDVSSDELYDIAVLKRSLIDISTLNIDFMSTKKIPKKFHDVHMKIKENAREISEVSKELAKLEELIKETYNAINLNNVGQVKRLSLLVEKKAKDAYLNARIIKSLQELSEWRAEYLQLKFN